MTVQQSYYGFVNNGGISVILNLKENLYGPKQVAYNCFVMLKKCIDARGCKLSAIDLCVNLRKECIVPIYMDDCISQENTSVASDLMKSILDDGF